jgi:hypothetical protein
VQWTAALHTRRSPPYVPLGCTARRPARPAPVFGLQKMPGKCRRSAPPRPRAAASAAPQRLSKRLIWLTISCSPLAAARRGLARRPAWKVPRKSSKSRGGGTLRLGASRPLHDRRGDKSAAPQRLSGLARPWLRPAKWQKAAASVRARQSPRAGARSTPRPAGSSRPASCVGVAASGLVLPPISNCGARPEPAAKRSAAQCPPSAR